MVNAERLNKILERALGRPSFWQGADLQLAMRASHEARVVRIARDLRTIGRNDLAVQLLDGEQALLLQSDYPPAA